MSTRFVVGLVATGSLFIVIAMQTHGAHSEGRSQQDPASSVRSSIPEQQRATRVYLEFPMLSLNQFVDLSTLVVHARLEDVVSKPWGGLVVQDATFTVIDRWLGQSEPVITVRYMGGTVGDRRTLCAKSPDFERGREYVLMLARLHLTLAGHENDERALSFAEDAVAYTGLRDPRFKRILAQAALRVGQYEKAKRYAKAAADEKDEPAYCHLIGAIAAAHMGDSKTARDLLDQARDNWPKAFETGGVIVTAEKEVLWFDTRAELEGLLTEAELAIAALPIPEED